MAYEQSALTALAKKTGSVSFIKIVGSALGLILTALITRSLGSTEAGSIFFALSSLYAMELFARLGTHRLFVKEIAIHHHSAENDKLRLAIGNAYILTLSTGTFATIFFYTTSFSISKISPDQSNLIYLFEILSFSAPIYSLAWISGFILQAIGRPALLVLQQNVALQTFFILFFLLIEPNSLTEIIFYWATANFLCAALAVCIVTTLHKPIFSCEQGESIGIKVTQARSLWWTDIASLIERHGIVIYLGLTMSLEVSGIFFVAMRINKAVAGIAGSLNTVIAPVFARLYATDGHTAVASLYLKVTLALFCLSAIGLIMAILGLESLLTIFGEKYKGAYFTCSILIIGTLFNISTGPTGQVLAMTGNQAVEGKASTLRLASLSFLMGPLSLAYGAGGAATAIAASVFLASLYRLLAIRRIFWR